MLQVNTRCHIRRSLFVCSFDGEKAIVSMDGGLCSLWLNGCGVPVYFDLRKCLVCPRNVRCGCVLIKSSSSAKPMQLQALGDSAVSDARVLLNSALLGGALVF
jgi:hypothetical protein